MQNEEIRYDCHPVQIEGILMLAIRAGILPLSVPDMRRRMLHGRPFARLSPACRRLMLLAQFGKQPFGGMDHS